METTLHRRGNDFAIRTTAENEDEFRQQFVQGLNKILIDGDYASDEPFVMEEWLKHAFEIVCKFRGYKSQVVVRQQITAGHIEPDAAQVAISRSVLAASEPPNGKVKVAA